jgi:hypothetical protein
MSHYNRYLYNVVIPDKILLSRVIEHSLDADRRHRYYFFNSFFYKKLTEKQPATGSSSTAASPSKCQQVLLLRLFLLQEADREAACHGQLQHCRVTQ